MDVLAGKGDEETCRELGDPKSEASQVLKEVRSVVRNVLEGEVDLRALPDVDGWYEYLDDFERLERIAELQEDLHSQDEAIRLQAAEALRQMGPDGLEAIQEEGEQSTSES